MFKPIAALIPFTLLAIVGCGGTSSSLGDDQPDSQNQSVEDDASDAHSEGSSPDPTGPDAGQVSPDSGQESAQPDSGSATSDTGTTTVVQPEAAAPETGTTQPESGSGDPDTGTTTVPDSGSTTPDTGSTVVPDSGTTAPEAGTTTADDGGQPQEDAQPDAPPAPICTLGATQCSGNIEQQCAGSPANWVTLVTCPFVCLTGPTGASCGGQCVPNSVQCVDIAGGDTEQYCDSAGAWRTQPVEPPVTVDAQGQPPTVAPNPPSASAPPMFSCIAGVYCSNNSANYVVNVTQNTVLDTTTGLTWQRQPPFSTFSVNGSPLTAVWVQPEATTDAGATFNPGIEFPYSAMAAYCSNLPGASWTVPTVAQMETIMVQPSQCSPMFNQSVFLFPIEPGIAVNFWTQGGTTLVNLQNQQSTYNGNQELEGSVLCVHN